jgi:hypothetical protein
MKKLWACLLLWGTCLSPVAAADSPWKTVEKVFGRPGIEQEGLFKVVFPRTDLNVLVEGIPLEPDMALTTWFAFVPLDGFDKARPEGHEVPLEGLTAGSAQGRQTFVMGELVLLDQEVSGVLSALVEGGFKVAALHHLVLGESPGIQCVQITGQGKAGGLARKLKQVLRETGTPLTSAFRPAPSPTTAGMTRTPSAAVSPATPLSRATATPTKNPADDWAPIRAVLGPGQARGKILEYCHARNTSIQENGVEIPPLLGTATCFRFQKVGDKVAVIGTFVLFSHEVNPMVETLIRHQLKVTSINHHLLDETPRLIFLHFWGVGKPGKIARALKGALKPIR